MVPPAFTVGSCPAAHDRATVRRTGRIGGWSQALFGKREIRMHQRTRSRLAGLLRAGLAVGLLSAALGVAPAAAQDIRDYRPRPSVVPLARPGQPGFVPPTLMHLDPCGDRVEGRSRNDVEEFWEDVEDEARDAYKDAIRDRRTEQEAELAAAREAAKEAIDEGGNRWDAALAAAAAVRRTDGELAVAGKGAYDAVLAHGGTAIEADDAASWAIQRVSQVPVGWKPKQMIGYDRWCLRSLQEVQINLYRMREYERQRSLSRLYYRPYYPWWYGRHRHYPGFYFRLD